MHIIVEKIILPSASPHVLRPRLLGLLRESLASSASTIINGRAGAGKTILAADFAATCGRATAWYKVDASDSELEIFFKYLVLSIQQQRPGFGGTNLRPLFKKSDIKQIPLLAEAVVFELLQGEHWPLLIVIEDLHLVYDAEWIVPFFGRLLPLLPGDVHLIITSRTMPPAPLWRMRSKQSLCVIEEAELAFTSKEAIELFESRGLSGEQALVALDQTHGRASALEAWAKSLAPTEKSRTRSAGTGTDSDAD